MRLEDICIEIGKIPFDAQIAARQRIYPRDPCVVDPVVQAYITEVRKEYKGIAKTRLLREIQEQFPAAELLMTSRRHPDAEQFVHVRPPFRGLKYAHHGALYLGEGDFDGFVFAAATVATRVR